MKTKLTLDSLRVETFAVPAEAPRDRGTVEGHQVQSRPITPCYSQHSCVYPCTDNPEECVLF